MDQSADNFPVSVAEGGLSPVSQIRTSEGLYQTLLDSLQDGIWTIDAAGNTTFVNPSMARLLGTAVEEMIGKPCFHYVFEEDAERARELFCKKLEGDREPFEFRIRREDGSSFWALVSGIPLHDNNATVIGLLGTFHDITERKLVEDAITRHSEELARANADLQQFAYVTAHDLREPLRTMRTYAQLLLRRYGGKFDSDADMFLNFIASSSERMDRLLNDVLSYSTAAERDGNVVRPLKLSAALEWAMKNLQTAISESGATIHSEELPNVLGDELQLVHLFQNLLSNAIKYRRPGERPQVNVSAERKADDWIIAVRDNGIGIKQDHHESIFGIFKRLHGSEISGTGIGLAISRKVVQNHGGRIWVESEPDHGSTFFFTLRPSPGQERYTDQAI